VKVIPTTPCVMSTWWTSYGEQEDTKDRHKLSTVSTEALCSLNNRISMKDLCLQHRSLHNCIFPTSISYSQNYHHFNIYLALVFVYSCNLYLQNYVQPQIFCIFYFTD